MAGEDDEALRARVARLEGALQASEREAENVDALQRRVAELERQVAAKSAAPAPDPRAVLLRRMAQRGAARSTPGAPPRLFDPGTRLVIIVALSVSTIMGTGFLPTFGIGALVGSAACPAGSKSSYTRHYRQILNGNVSDHWEFRCVTAAGQDVVGNEVLVYLTGAGLGLGLGLVITAVMVLSRRARLRKGLI
jgi:hypothetical protein